MKLTRNKLLEVIKLKNLGWTTYKIKKKFNVSIRRINQVYSYYLQNKEPPTIGRRMGRPTRPITSKETTLVKETYAKYLVSASTLEKIIKRDHNTQLPHNHIHKIMKLNNLAKTKKNKDVRKKKWIRYQRKHSLTAVHIDWHYNGITRKWIFAVIDDASRKLLALLETNSPTTEYSIQGMKNALTHGKIKQCISDHGSQFISNIGGESIFVEFLKQNNIKQVLCKIKHPQSNGKIEKWFGTYDRHRNKFQTKEQFTQWYNEIRPHKSLKFEELETPSQAFQRKLKAEA